MCYCLNVQFQGQRVNITHPTTPALKFLILQGRSNISLCSYYLDACQIWQSEGRARWKCDGTRAETRFGLSGKRTSSFKSAGESIHSTTGSRGVRISGSNGSNTGYTMFWGRVKDYWLPTPLISFPFTSPPVRHRVPSGFNWAILGMKYCPLARKGTQRLFTLMMDLYILFSSKISSVF